MKSKKILKTIIILFIILNCIFPAIIIEASNGNFNPQSFESSSGVPNEINTFTNNALGTAISIARIAGTGIAIIMLTVIACKYMMAAPGDRADIKKHAIPFVIGACVMFGASGILGFIAQISANI